MLSNQINKGSLSQFLRFGTSTNPVEIPEEIVKCLKQRCTKEEPLHELFKCGEMIAITQGSFKGFIGFFEKLQTLPDGLSRSMLLVEVLGSVHKLQIQLPQLSKFCA